MLVVQNVDMAFVFLFFYLHINYLGKLKLVCMIFTTNFASSTVHNCWKVWSRQEFIEI